MVTSEQEFERAEARSQKEREAGHVISARYDRRRRRVIALLNTGVEIAFPAAQAEGLADASPEDLAQIEISPTGLGLHWPRLDADLYVPALMRGVFGSRSWMAAQMGTAGGRARSAAKAIAARDNGRRGGRPRGTTGENFNESDPAQIHEAKSVARQVRRLIDLNNVKLGKEYYPAHLSVALIDAVFTTRLRYEAQVVPIIDRYCQHFGLMRTRADRNSLPRPEEQETLGDLIEHYEIRGIRLMEDDVFKARYCSPGTRITKVENVYRSAVALRDIGLENLQDAASKPPWEIKCALRQLSGIGPRTIHMFLMYVGDENYVKGDVHICRFVAGALGKKRVRAEKAERIVQEAAGILGVRPRFLDFSIWQYESGSIE
ncbi:MAG: DUF2442 domain-containing protein [Rhodospirillaceae bacterium]|nr:DUF2442 domain-containing protein [Rhodospirillaceae bacterium]